MGHPHCNGKTAAPSLSSICPGPVPVAVLECHRNDAKGRARRVRRGAKTVMNRFIAALLPILVSSLSFSVVYAADAPTASDDTQSVAIVTTPLLSEDTPTTHLSLAGLGSLHWAARQPAQAWKVLLPIQPEG